jgi:hypothetical protein
MNPIIKPENIRIYRKSDGTYTIRPEGTYVPWLGHFDRLTSLTVSTYPSAAEARKEIESTWRVSVTETLPVYLAFDLNGLPKDDSIPGLDRITITVEDLTYLGMHLCTVAIVGIHSPQNQQERITYEDCMPKALPPIHHQALFALDQFCQNAGGPIQDTSYRDSFGSFYLRFAWNGDGVVIILSSLHIHDHERRGHGLLTELIEHLKLDSRVMQIRLQSTPPTRLKEHLKRIGFKDSAKSYLALSRGDSWN